MSRFEQTDEFTEWLQKVDIAFKGKIINKINHVAQMDKLPDKICTLMIGLEGVWEMKFDFGPGFRAYFCQYDRISYLLLTGGIKKNQTADKNRAAKMKETELQKLIERLQ